MARRNQDQDQASERDADKTETLPGSSAGAPQENPTEHQEGAPEDVVKAVEEAQEKGYIGEDREDRPDYSQANSDVMNGGK